MEVVELPHEECPVCKARDEIEAARTEEREQAVAELRELGLYAVPDEREQAIAELREREPYPHGYTQHGQRCCDEAELICAPRENVSGVACGGPTCCAECAVEAEGRWGRHW